MLFLLYGEDNFRSKEKLFQLRKAFSEKNPSSEIIHFDFSEKQQNHSGFLESFSTNGLFSQKKMLVAMNFMKNVPAEQQRGALEKLKGVESAETGNDLAIIFWEEGNPKKNLSLWKYLSLKSKKQQFDLLDPRGLERWAADYLKNNYPEIVFENRALSLFVSNIGSDLHLLKNELEKLANFKNSGEISEADVDMMVKSHMQSNIFRATEALLAGNKKNALKLFHGQIESGVDPFYVLAMYTHQIRVFLKISSCLESQNVIASNISRETGLHPFVVQKSLPQARKTGQIKLKILFSALQKIDLDSKTGRVDVRLALDKFIAEI